MRLVLTALLVLAAAQAAAGALALLLTVSVVWGALFRPRETLGLMGLLLVAGLVESHPLPCLGLVALVVVAGVLRRRRAPLTDRLRTPR